jgi:LemA protein
VKAAVLGVLAMLAIGIAAAAKYKDVRSELTAQRDGVEAQWVLVDDALRRRAELMPDLAAIVKPAHVGDAVFQDLEGSREALLHATAPIDKMRANDRLSNALARLLLLTESDPGLRAGDTFQRLQDEVAEKENRIFLERRKYNEMLERYNAQIQMFPENVVARLSGFERNDAYFQTAPGEQTVPRVQ